MAGEKRRATVEAAVYSHYVAVTVGIGDTDDVAVLTARTQAKATIRGSNNTLPLRLTIHSIGSGGGWPAAYFVASTW